MMEMNLSPLDQLNRLWHFIPRYTKIQFCSAFIIGILVHLYLMASGMVNHDSVVVTEYYQWAHNSMGRWFAIVPNMITGSFNIMWLNALFALVYVSIAACLIGACLEIRRTPLVLLLSGVIVSFPALAGWLSYRFYVPDTGMFPVLLSCLAIFLARRFKYGFLFGAIPLLFSLALYQAYIGFFAGVMVLILIRDILTDQKIKTVIVRALKYLATLFIALIAYVISLNLPSYSYLAGYKDIRSFGGLTIQNLPERFIFSYKDFFDVFFRNSLKLHQDYWLSGQVYQYLFAIAVIAVLVLLIFIIINTKLYRDKVRLILLIIAIALLPPACNIIAVLSPDNLYILMQYSLVLIFALVLIVIDIASEKVKGSKAAHLSTWFLLVFCFVITINYAIYSNVFYLKMDLLNKHGQAFATSLVTRIQSEDFYDLDTPIILYGSAPHSFALGYFEYMDAIPLEDFPNMYSLPAYLLIYQDLKNPVYRSSKYFPEELRDNEAVMRIIADMPAYPLNGSIKLVEGFIIVKFSDQ